MGKSGALEEGGTANVVKGINKNNNDHVIYN